TRRALADNCSSCHGPKRQRGGLRLDSAASLRKGGDSGAVVVPGRPEKSLLIQAVRRAGERKMPPEKELSARAVADLAAWVQMGAPWPESATAAKEPDPADAWKKHWAFQPVKRPAVPHVPGLPPDAAPVDAFRAAGLGGRGLATAPPAHRRTLLRRVTFDLPGLPPTAEEIEAFVQDPAPDAFARVVDRLLASPHYGERWGRHWLDVAR